MKKLISGLVMMLAVAFTVSAQDTTKHRGSHEYKMQKELLQLSDAQKNELKDLNAQYRQKELDIRNNSALSEAQKNDQRKDLMKQRKADMDKILTAEQKKQIAEARKKGMKDHKGMKGDKNKSVKRSGRKGESPMKDLDLTAAQSAKVKSINAQYREKMMELKKNKTAEKAAQQSAFATLRKQHREEIRQVLTAEQLQKLEARKKQKTTR